MTKSEFLEILRQQLDGEMSSSEIYSNIHYYDQYIDKELSSGKTEEEVMNKLGDPRWIAKTLIDADEGPYYNSTYQDVSYRTDRSEQQHGTPTEEAQEDFSQESPTPKVRRLNLNTWYGKSLVILCAAAVIFLLVTALTMLIPVAIVLVLIGLVISMFKKKQ